MYTTTDSKYIKNKIHHVYHLSHPHVYKQSLDSGDIDVETIVPIGCFLVKLFKLT